MSNGGYLVPPEDTAKGPSSEIWEETWKRVDRFLPNLFVEIFPPLPSTVSVSAPVEQQQQNQQVSVPPPQGSVAPVAAALVPTVTPAEKTKEMEAVDLEPCV